MQFIDLKSQFRRVEHDVRRRIDAVLEHGQYIMGPEVAELEAALAEFVGVRHCVGLASGTDALLAALMALGVKPEDEVITSAFTFIATGEMIALLGAKPVFVDIDPVTYNIDVSRIEAAITSKTRVIMPVSLYGQCADMEAIVEIAERRGLSVIEDAAQSFGAVRNGRKSCSYPDVACTSFFPAKPLGAYGDAGACFTDDESLAKAIREIRNHGQDRRYHHPRLGINGRLDTLQAAILLAKLSVFPDEVERRGALGARYTSLFSARGAGSTCESSAPLLTPHLAHGNASVYAQYTVQVSDRDTVAQRLQDQGIPTAVHYPVPLNQQPVFAEGSPGGQTDVTRRIAQNVLSLPMHPYLEHADQDRIVDAVCSAVGL